LLLWIVMRRVGGGLMPGSGAIVHRSNSLFVGAVSAAVKAAAGLDTMPDDLAPAMFTLGGQRLHGALEAVKVAGDAGDDDLDGLIVFVSTNFALAHSNSLWGALSAPPSISFIK
jgi:hypothetical protein